MKTMKFPIIACFMAFILLISVIPAEFVSASTPTPQKVNDYSLQVANFIKDKCNGKCDNIILLGDDYVIPSFRRSLPMLNWYSFLPWLPEELFPNTKVDKIITDIPYVQRTGKTFAEFDKLFVKTDWMGQESKGKDVVFIVTSGMSSSLMSQINELGDVLQDKDLALDVKIKQDTEVTCNEKQLWDNFNGKTLFVFGTDNQALNCFPFVAKMEDTAFIDVNPWDGRNYAVILQTTNPDIIQTFKVIVENDKYKNLQSEWITFVDTGLIIGSIAASFFGVDTFVDGVDAAFQCGIVGNVIACGASTVALVIPLLPSGIVRTAIKKFTSIAGDIGEKFLLKYGDESFLAFGRLLKKGGLEAIDSFGSSMKKIGTYFGDSWDNIAKNLNWGAADEVLASQGAKRVGSLDNFAPHLAKEVQADLLHTVGKADEALQLGDNAVKEIKYVDASDELLDGAPASFDGETIRISKTANIQDVKKVLIPHEMAHAKIFESLSPEINSMLDKEVLEQFDEFLADNLAKSRVSGYTLKSVDEIKTADNVLNRYYLIEYGVPGLYEKGSFDLLAHDVAFAKINSPEKYTIFKNTLSNYKKGPQILDLADEYAKYSNDLPKLNTNVLNDIADKTAGLIK